MLLEKRSIHGCVLVFYAVILAIDYMQSLDTWWLQQTPYPPSALWCTHTSTCWLLCTAPAGARIIRLRMRPQLTVAVPCCPESVFDIGQPPHNLMESRPATYMSRSLESAHHRPHIAAQSSSIRQPAVARQSQNRLPCRRTRELHVHITCRQGFAPSSPRRAPPAGAARHHPTPAARPRSTPPPRSAPPAAPRAPAARATSPTLQDTRPRAC